MPAFETTGTITRKSNGTIEFTPTDQNAKLPAMGDEVTLSVEVIATAAEVDKRRTVKEPEPVVVTTEPAAADRRRK